MKGALDTLLEQLRVVEGNRHLVSEGDCQVGMVPGVEIGLHFVQRQQAERFAFTDERRAQPRASAADHARREAFVVSDIVHDDGLVGFGHFIEQAAVFNLHHQPQLSFVVFKTARAHHAQEVLFVQ